MDMKTLHDVIIQKRRNLYLSFAALFLLLVSLFTLTYCWVEGASSLEIVNGAVPLKIGDTSSQIALAQENSLTADLSSYIDTQALYLAPAKCEDGVHMQIKQGDAFRDATVNDIGNNYIDFEVPITVSNETKLIFTNDSSILVDGSALNPIRVSVTLMDIDRKNPKTTLFSSDLADQTVAVVPENSKKILRFKIWNDCTVADFEDFSGKTVSLKLELSAFSNLTSLTFADRTANKSDLYLTSDKTMKVAAVVNGVSKTYTMTKGEDNTYTTGRVIPVSALSSVEFQCYSGETLLAKWSGNEAAENGTYTAYGSAFESSAYGTGTWGDVVKLNFHDYSLEHAFDRSSYTTVTNGVDLYYCEMYYDSNAKNWFAYVPKSTFTSEINPSGKVYFNGRNAEKQSMVFCEADVSGFNELSTLTDTSYSVYGNSKIQGAEFGDALYYGKWCSSADFITVQDKTPDRSVLAAGENLQVSFDGVNYYYAKYNELYKTWTFNVPGDTTEPLLLKAAVSDDLVCRYDASGRTVSSGGQYIYTLTSAAAGPDGYCSGTWEYTETGTKITFIDATANTDYFVDLYLYDGSTAYKMTQDTDKPSIWTVYVEDSVKSNLKFYRCSKDFDLDINNHIVGAAAASAGYYNCWNAGTRYFNTQFTATQINNADANCLGNWSDIWKITGGTLQDLTFEKTETAGIYTALYNASAAEETTFKLYNSASLEYYSNAGTVINGTTEPLAFTKAETALCKFNISGAGKYTFTLDLTGDNPTLKISGVANRVIYLKNTAGWTSCYAHYWINGGTDSTTWPGVPMEYVSGNIWKIEVPVRYDSIIFNQSGYPQTSDLTIPTDGKNLYDNKTNTWSVYDPDTPVESTYYLRGTFNEWGDANRMSFVGGSDTTVTVTLTVNAGDYTFKINNSADNSWYSSQTGITDTCTNQVLSASVSDNCSFTSTTGGTYLFEYNIVNHQLTVTKV